VLQLATKYTDVGEAARPVRTARRPAGLFLPTLPASANCVSEWFWREIKDGGMLEKYFRREKALMPQVIRMAGRLMHGFKQNPKSDFERKASIPAKLYHRWKNEDEHFFDDDANLRSLKRDNPDLPVFVGPRVMPHTAQRKTYPNQLATETQRTQSQINPASRVLCASVATTA
jgi:hypothetical protein